MNQVTLYRLLKVGGRTGIILLLVSLFSCGQKGIDPELIGTWVSGKQKITVRTGPGTTGYRFVSGYAHTVLTIREDRTVFGKVGNAHIANGQISTNWVLPTGMTGVAYTISCELSGRIFDGDPMAHKEVEFWVGPDYQTGDWELRYTTGGSQFPMGFLHFSKRAGSK